MNAHSSRSIRWSLFLCKHNRCAHTYLREKKNCAHNEHNGFKQERVHGCNIEIKLGLLWDTELDVTGPKIGLGHDSILSFDDRFFSKKKNLALLTASLLNFQRQDNISRYSFH